MNLQAADPIVGSQWAKNMLEAYEQGQFSDFLSSMEDRYAEGSKNNEWEELRNPMETFYAQQDEETRRIIENVKNYREELDSLRGKRNQLLQSVALEHPNEFVSQIIIDLFQYKPNELSGSDFVWPLEHCFKMNIFQTLVSMDILEGGEVKGAFPKSLELSQVIRLYNLEQVLKESVDENLKQEIINIQSGEFDRIAHQYNECYLNHLAKSAQADSEAEVLVSEIMNDFQESKKELLKKYSLYGSLKS